MTVGDVLKLYNLSNCDIDIMYRTIGPDQEDIFAGYCRYEGGEELKSLDNDSYALDDVVCDFSLEHDKNDDPYLIVWYEAEWVNG